MDNWGFGPRLRDKVALISGIGSGQGRAAALLFSTQVSAKVPLAFEHDVDAGGVV